MTLSLKHKFTSAIPDAGDPTIVQPSNWNDEHALTQATATILGRVTAGTGVTEELTPAQARTLLNVADGATANSTDAFLLARANHTGTESADVLTDGTTNKAFLATERTKLAGIATGATANSTDAFLLARANHTGTQSADTLTDGTTNKAFLATERTKLAGIATGADVTATALNATAKGTPVDADRVHGSDSAASFGMVYATWTQVKAFLKTYFDTLYQPLLASLTSWGAVGRAAGFDTFAATPSSANLRALLSDEVGTGAAYFVGGALGTPASGTATNLTGLPVSTGISGLAAGVATFLATPSSANLLAAVTDETGTGALVFGTQPTFTSGAQWSSSNYGAALVASGTRNNAIGILDSAGGNPWAIANTTGGLLRVSKMPALGNTATAPIDCFVLDTGGDAGTGDPLVPPYQVAPFKTKLALSGVYADSASGNIFQISSWVRNSGTSPTVAGFFLGEATGAGSKTWGINVTAFANNATANADAIEIDFASLVAGGFSNGALIVYGSALADTDGAYVWCQANDVKSALYGLMFSKNGANAPIRTTGSILKTSGAYTIASGIDISSVTLTTAFKSNGFSVDGSGNINGAALFSAIHVGGAVAASTLTLRATTGAGAGAEAIIFQVGNAGATEVLRMLGAGNIQYGSANFAANAAVATVLGSLGPTGSHTTVQKWLKFKDNGGTDLFVPCF